MTAKTDMTTEKQLTSALRTVEERALSAIDKIAPSWPLDQMIAVNPYWKLRDQSFTDVSAYLAALADINCHISEKDYITLHEKGYINDELLAKIAQDHGVDLTAPQLLEVFKADRATPNTFQTIAALVDAFRSEHQMQWREAMIYQVSQFCAAHYQQQMPLLQQASATTTSPLYDHWLSTIRQDRGISILLSEPELSKQFTRLPDDELALIALATETLSIDESMMENYFHGLLLDINGWASTIAYFRWQQDLGDKNQQDDGTALLAIRLAWELVLYWHYQDNYPKKATLLTMAFQQEQGTLPKKIQMHQQHQQLLWVWAKALEATEQKKLQHKLQQSLQQFTEQQPSASEQLKEPSLQAVFCIDVRSEVIRRALESQNDQIETYGFAGFFGLPIAYEPKHTGLKRPQLPGLLAPGMSVEERDDSTSVQQGIRQQAGWQRWGQSANGGFSLVESAGWMYGFNMIKQSLFPKAEENPVNQLSHQKQWDIYQSGELIGLKDKVNLCQGILGVMGITVYAESVLLVGHGSHTANNLHAAGLDCGACGGQTGEVNVRVLAQLLNDLTIRDELNNLGCHIPATTTFVPALHNTTTDVIECFDTDVVKPTEQVQQWLRLATESAQLERAKKVAPKWTMLTPAQRHKKFISVSNDWSQTRPEWGLANNHAFVIAPRAWTRNANFDGRVFLHDYTHTADPERQVLELLMTAPMIVTHWINMQYNASTTDNHKYGSGNKVLHNAVGGNLGVFEGNGGDLRIGLSKQSLHNGEQWMHTAQRLQIYIAAPQDAIADIVKRHKMIRELIDNEWIYLYQWHSSDAISRYIKGQWQLN